MTSAKHTRNFTVHQIKNDTYGVTVLSVFSDGHLLVGQYDDRQLCVYSVDGSHVTSVTLPNDYTQRSDFLQDAVWTPRGTLFTRLALTKLL